MHPAAAGCGQASPDLFAVERSGQGPNAKLNMVVSDGGSVTCNGTRHDLGSDRLLKAREVARDLSRQAELRVELPPRRGSVLRYRVHLEAGTVSFADTSAPMPPSFAALEAFTKDVAEDVCGINR